jgi:hypothetical protein
MACVSRKCNTCDLFGHDSRICPNCQRHMTLSRCRTLAMADPSHGVGASRSLVCPAGRGFVGYMPRESYPAKAAPQVLLRMEALFPLGMKSRILAAGSPMPPHISPLNFWCMAVYDI